MEPFVVTLYGHTVRIESDVPLPGAAVTLLPFEAQVDRAWQTRSETTIRVSTHAGVASAAESDGHVPALLARAGIRSPRLLARTHDSLQFSTSAPLSVQAVRRLLAAAFTSRLQPPGWHCWHAATIGEPGGDAVLIAGASGVGKSTAAAQLAARPDTSSLTDNYTLVDPLGYVRAFVDSDRGPSRLSSDAVRASALVLLRRRRSAATISRVPDGRFEEYGLTCSVTAHFAPLFCGPSVTIPGSYRPPMWVLEFDPSSTSPAALAEMILRERAGAYR